MRREGGLRWCVECKTDGKTDGGVQKGRSTTTTKEGRQGKLQRAFDWWLVMCHFIWASKAQTLSILRDMSYIQRTEQKKKSTMLWLNNTS